MFAIRWNSCTVFSVLIVNLGLVKCEFSVPNLQFEAYEPKGFRVSIPADDGVQLFGFHGNLNKKISQIEPGDLSEDVTRPENSIWSYNNKDQALQVGDTIHYWVFVQHKYLGYRKSGELKVDRLIKPSENQCNAANTLVNGGSKGCINQVIFEDEFGTGIDSNKWTVEHYIPNQGPDYEFVSYQSSACQVIDNKLKITPTVLTKQELGQSLDLKKGCTRSDITECVQKFGAIFLPPIKSGKLTSKFKFTYGTVEIKAKLPTGDWIYPEIYLEMNSNQKERIYIAYARGNKALNFNGENIGGSCLYGGPDESLSFRKFASLQKQKSQKAFTEAIHVYKVSWTPEKIELYVDGAKYGETTLTPAFKNSAQLVLGVGVGGINDFPEGSTSNGYSKPWKNSDRDMFKDFYNQTSNWKSSWTDSSLLVDYVKIRAI
ncbi:unnamed protein product [Brassicogethes aeneus]|uniref:Uncharacterized protein n=1 Tax=Brassicogethes aeneus TaxID=1431903 RepID=A0A9P0F8Y4_BRAAE|nr:unnamed protein product [Brassicogethes aeneus]